MICKKHPRIAKSSFLVMVNVALECVCVCVRWCVSMGVDGDGKVGKSGLTS